MQKKKKENKKDMKGRRYEFKHQSLGIGIITIINALGFTINILSDTHLVCTKISVSSINDYFYWVIMLLPKIIHPISTPSNFI